MVRLYCGKKPQMAPARPQRSTRISQRLDTGLLERRGFTGCGKTRLACHSEESRSDRDDEESRTALEILRARFLAEFTLSGQSEILRCAQDDSEGLGMTAWRGFSAACSAPPKSRLPPFRTRGENCGLTEHSLCSWSLCVRYQGCNQPVRFRLCAGNSARTRGPA